MPPGPAPAPTPPTIRQRSVLQSNSPARELAVFLPSESLPSSRVLLVLFTTISGGAQAHVPTSQVWRQVPLVGVNGYTQFGNVLVSAWLSRPGSPVYSAGLFQFAGMVGLAPEYSTAMLFELQNCQNGEISLSAQSWNTSYSNTVTGTAPAIGQQVRGVLAVGFTEGEHVFTEPPGDQAMQTQTAASGFFAAPFSVAGSYAGQLSNDPSVVSLPFTGATSRTGILLFSAITGDAGIDSPQSTMTTNVFTAYPTATITVDARIGYGGDLTATVDAAISFDPMTAMSSSDASLFGDPTAAQTLGTQTYLQVPNPHTTSSALEVFYGLEDPVDVSLLGFVDAASTSSSAIVNSLDADHGTDGGIMQDLWHLTDAYVFAGQTSHLSDGLLMSTSDLTHTTDAALVNLVSASHSTDSSILSAEPLLQYHTSDSLLEQDAVIGMAGWELKDYYAEVYVATYYLAGGVTISVDAAAKRPGSLGTVGLIIDNTGASLANSYVEIPQTSRVLQQLSPTTEWPTFAAAVYREVWVSFWFQSPTQSATNMDTLASDERKAFTVTPPGPGGIGGGLPVYGYSWWLTRGATYGAITGGALLLGCGSLPGAPSGLTPAFTFASVGSGWHLCEVRMYSNVALDSVSSADPMTVEVYLDNEPSPRMTISSPIPCSGRPSLGMQEKLNTDPVIFHYDDVVYSTRRLFNLYDLSVIHKPAKADGFYTEWTGTPTDTFADVANVPSDPAEYFESAALGDRSTVKVYSGGDSNPYPGYIHAVTLQAVHTVNLSSSSRNVALMVREGGVDLELKAWAPNHAEKTYQAFMVTTSRSPIGDDSWVDALYDFEVGVRQVVDSNVNRVHGIGAMLLVSPFSYAHRTDTTLSSEVSKTHTTDVVLARADHHYTDALLKTIGDFHTTDAYLFRLNDLAHTTTATIAGEIDETHGTDIFIDRLASHTTDTVIVEVRGSVHTNDTLLSGQREDSHDADAGVGALVDLPHLADFLAYRLVELAHTTDVAKLLTPTMSHSTNARNIAAISATHTANGLVRATISSTHTADAIKYTRVDQQHNTSAAKIGEPTASHQVYAWTAPTNVIAQLHTTSPSIRSTFTAAITTDAFLKTSPTAGFTTNATVFGTRETFHGAFAWINHPSTLGRAHTTNAKLIGEVDRTHTGNALIRDTYTLSISTDTRLELVPEKTHSVDTLKYYVGLRAHSTSSLLYGFFSATHDQDALLRSTFVGTHSTDAKLTGEVSSPHATGSAVSGEASATHTSNAIAKATVEAMQTLNAALGFDAAHTGNSLIGIAAQNEHALAASLAGAATSSHAADVILFAQLDAVHTTNCAFIGQMGVFHSTSGALLGIVELQWLTDSCLASELLFTSSTNTAGEAAGSHTTNAVLDNNDLGPFEPDEDVFQGAFN